MKRPHPSIAVPCPLPTCQAPAGQLCRGRRGKNVASFHAVRKLALQDQRREEKRQQDQRDLEKYSTAGVMVQ